ncbi:hypothetical protein EV649_5922 [Kribbella sp. VKM Ac-2569]|uniref:hypothetical protein n=1 Tax=Kribbella sp. VKM Ac-2569 TaxID=2512220 RepID=UPI00102B8BE7|nr:hypothetical protein [Kribbella sp. VKM Ac-2569]RZT15138.1 hypothetical protein EV649_5922 [Kribbella sp. VKM Ac-2569]
MWILGVVAAVVVVVGLVLWWLLRGPDDDLDSDEDFAVPRKWEWEFQLTEEQEKALMEGLHSYHRSKDGPIAVHSEHADVTLFAPYTVISLYLLADRFVALGPDAVSYPMSSVGRLLDECADQEQPGVLHLRHDWFPDEGADGMDTSAFADLVMDVLMQHPDRRVIRASWNGDGLVEAAIRATDESRQDNRLALDLARVLEQYGAARQAQPQTPPLDLLRMILPRMVTSEIPGVLWIRPATADERNILADAGRQSS